MRETLSSQPLDIRAANKALRQAISYVVMDAEDGTLTAHWHHAEQPSDPIYFVSKHIRWAQPTSTNDTNGTEGPQAIES